MVTKAPDTQLAYELKITLLGTKPPVWRGFCVPGEITLDRLHDVIQIVMGWNDSHLHLFKINGKSYAEKPEEKSEGDEEKYHRLCDLVTSDQAHFDYDYDFGDGWNHRITVKRISKVPEGYRAATRCQQGKRRCPPEDVGGTQGYVEFLNACKDAKHPDHKQMLRWAGGSFNPNDFDPEAVNLELFKYARWSRPRANELELGEG